MRRQLDIEVYRKCYPLAQNESTSNESSWKSEEVRKELQETKARNEEVRKELQETKARNDELRKELEYEKYLTRMKELDKCKDEQERVKERLNYYEMERKESERLRKEQLKEV